MEKTDYGSLIAFTKSESELRENIVRTIASKIKDDYCVLPDIHFLENALIKITDRDVIELYLNEFISECKNAQQATTNLNP